MKYFYITSSELAKLTGHNKYEALDKTVNSLLKKFNIKAVYVPKTNIEEGLQTLTQEQQTILKEELLELSGFKDEPYMYQDNQLLYLEKLIQQTIVYPTQKSDLSEEQSKELFSQKVMNNGVLQSIHPYIEKDLRMRRGNVKESNNLDKLQKKQNIQVVERNSKMYTKELVRTDRYCIVLRGKVDGMNGNTIIEAKSRRNKLFMELRDYERVQLEAYMFLTGYEKALLTEHYNDTSNQIEYNHNEIFWQGCVMSTVEFIDTYIVPHITG